MIKYQAGTVLPDEYNWKEQFSLEGIYEPFIMMDVGKVRGLAIALENAEEEIAEQQKQIENMHRRLTLMR